MNTRSDVKKDEWNWAKHKPNNCINVPLSSEKDFFKWWCIFQCPFVSLTNREIEVIASLLRHRHELSKVISDPEILDSQLMSDNIRNKVIKECKLTKSHYYVVMGTLKKKKIINNTGINPRLIPNIRQDDNGCFQLLVLFKGIN